MRKRILCRLLALLLVFVFAVPAAASGGDVVIVLDPGHGGMDTLMLHAFFDAVRSGDEMPIDVYDAASWMSITCLTEASIANGSQSIDIPDFTGGRWVMREPKDLVDLT